MKPDDLLYSEYLLYASNGKKIRKASLVRHPNMGYVIRFLELMPKSKAKKQAFKIWKLSGEGSE